MSGLDAIGNTPVVRLDRLAGDTDAEVWVKLEAANPTGSYKDRMALAMIEAAERDGRLQPGQLVVEYTGGSTGSSLAFVCAVKGYPLRIVSSDAFAMEKIRTMQAFGADVELVPSPQGITPDLIPAMMRRAGEIAAQTGAFWTDQFNNSDMIDGYRASRRGAARSSCPDRPPSTRSAATSAPPDASSARLGRCGPSCRHCTASWSSRPSRPCCRAAPAGTHHIEGGGTGRWPPKLTADDFDEVIAVPRPMAFAMARRAARSEGVFSGPSTGANLVAALDRRPAPRTRAHRVVTIQVDSGLKYLAGDLYT